MHFLSQASPSVVDGVEGASLPRRDSLSLLNHAIIVAAIQDGRVSLCSSLFFFLRQLEGEIPIFFYPDLL